MKAWRGGDIEFCDGVKNEFIARPPWWIVRLKGGIFYRPWYSWIDYGGPPKIFLTRKRAEAHARGLRRQYGGGTQLYGRLKVEVIKIGKVEGG
jgi:hypothetical protein